MSPSKLCSSEVDIDVGSLSWTLHNASSNKATTFSRHASDIGVVSRDERARAICVGSGVSESIEQCLDIVLLLEQGPLGLGVAEVPQAHLPVLGVTDVDRRSWVKVLNSSDVPPGLWVGYHPSNRLDIGVHRCIGPEI